MADPNSSPRGVQEGSFLQGTHVAAGSVIHSKEKVMQMQSREFADGDQTNATLGRGLGAFSVGLGLAELAAPAAVARLIGADRCGITRPALRLFGAREILTGLGLFASPQSVGGPWARVLGDMLDLAFLGYILKRKS